MEGSSITIQNFSNIALPDKAPNVAKPLAQKQGTHPLLPCHAPGLPRCVTDVLAVPPAETLWKFIELPWVKKTKIFHCEPPPEPSHPKRRGSQLAKEEVEEEQASEQSSPPTMDEEMQLEDILAEVNRIKGRVGEVDRQLESRIPDCPDIDPCVSMDVELLAFNTNPDILELQRNTHKLRQQLAELQLCRVATDKNIKDMRASVCREMEHADRLQKRLNELDSFKRTLEREQAICKQRFHFVEQVKVDGGECNNYFDSERKLMECYLDRLVTKLDYQQQKRRALKDIDYVKLKAKKFHDHMFYAIDKLDAFMGTDGRMHPPELLTFLSRNEKLFGPCTY
ncbi:uncharacterized protein LOC111073049 [Drosophila obscura]|uniref:uncharacterized protein LOC111073049 n=1 Tax=Drosophila obscura TaxID=7282 RepID=UPI001BB27DA7|nr:uncharacterized protein LOC111073049 [Drosophila obscura]